MIMAICKDKRISINISERASILRLARISLRHSLVKQLCCVQTLAHSFWS